MKPRQLLEILMAAWLVLVLVCYAAWVILPKLQGRI